MTSLKRQISATLFLVAFTATLQIGNTFRVAQAIRMVEEFEPVKIEYVPQTEPTEATETVPETVPETTTETTVKTIEETEPVEEVVENKVYLGVFKAYAYCDCEKCCGKWSGSPTASGTTPTQGRTIAVDPNVIPLGTEVYIEGYGNFVAEDTGTGIDGNTIDVFHISHADALEWGVRQVKIYKII
jgi:3D (Asp-Asp-Asp) domain-containing protein